MSETAERTRRRRRPSGEPPPLPRSPGWRASLIVLGALLPAGGLLALAYDKGVPPIDTSILEAAAKARGTWAESVAEVFSWFGHDTGTLVLRFVLIGVLIVFTRWRHLVLALVAFSLMDLVVEELTVPLPPPGVGTVGSATAFTFPAYPMAALSVTLGAMIYSLTPSGEQRRRAAAAVIIFAVLVEASRIILGQTYPVSATYSLVLGSVLAAVLYRFFAPEESFPVSYRRGGSVAHLALDESRVSAVTNAVRDQLGLEVAEVRSFGEEGSGGSTPLLLTLADGSHVFGKIIATSHVRSDRWYRLARTVMYGRLEDETPFSSALKLIEYEDYSLRLLEDEGFRVAHTYGIVELTPQREYLLVTEFFAGAETLGHAEVDDATIDQGLATVRRMWDVGLAHRDLKPANMLIVDGRLQLIDTAVLQVRPTPWRQAVDLANMMLVLALRTDADRVYERALTMFTPDDIAEAFASAVGMAIPTELQAHLKEDPRDLIGRFRELAPHHPPVSIQRWSLRRIGLTAACAAGVLLVGLWAVEAVRVVT